MYFILEFYKTVPRGYGTARELQKRTIIANDVEAAEKLGKQYVASQDRHGGSPEYVGVREYPA